MESEHRDPPPGALTKLEERLLAASVGRRLFKRPAEPVRFGRYRLLERLGHGGMGVVFSAHDGQLRRRVALKLLHAARGQPGREQHLRLRREARLLGRLSHPNVVQVFEVGEIDGHMFVAMELVRGVTLQVWLAERPRGVAEIVGVLVQAGRGLAAAHEAGIVHRDFKPENILVGPDGRTRVVDFGLARVHEDRGLMPSVDGSASALNMALTASGVLLGTPAFMAPEQARESARADARSDQFSFCVVLYEALYGERPFAGETLEDYLASVAAGSVRPAPAGKETPPGLREALLRGLRNDPADRWGTMDDLLAALTVSGALAVTPEARVGPATLASRRWPRRYSVMVALMLVLGAVIAVPSWLARRREYEARERLAVAEQELALLLAADDRTAARRVLIGLLDAPELAAQAWASWARMLGARGSSSRDAWAHAYVLATGERALQEEALLGLVRTDSREVAEVVALIAAEAPALHASSELLGPRTAAAAARRDLTGALQLARDPRSSAETRALEPLLVLLSGMTPALRPAEPGELPLSRTVAQALGSQAVPHIELPTTDGALAVDLDGDGRIDRASRADDGALRLARSREDGGSATLTIGGLELVGAAQLDDDLAQELVLSAPENGTLWLAGVGAQAPLPLALGAGAVAHAQRLADAAVPREVVALAHAGLPELALDTLVTLGEHASQRTRRGWLLAAATIADEHHDLEQVLAWLLDAADEPELRAAAQDLHVALLVRAGRFVDAADLNARRLATAELGVDARADAEALQGRLAALLAGRFALSLRFTGVAADPWTALVPAALRGDPVERTLVVDTPGEAGPLAVWALRRDGPRLLIELAVSPLQLEPGSGLGLRLLAEDDQVLAGVDLSVTTAQRDAADELRLSCARAADTPTRGSATIGPLHADGSYAPLLLQLDVDAVARTVECRVFDASRRIVSREPLARAGEWTSAPMLLELRSGGDAQAHTSAVLTSVAIFGARVAAPPPPPALERAIAPLIDGDPHAAALALTAIPDPRARLWQAVALAAQGRGHEAAQQFERALALDSDGTLEAELVRWLRAIARTMTPALRQALGEHRFLQLFARAWQRPLRAPRLAPALVRLLLGELGDLEQRCLEGDPCASLLHARGRALLQVGEYAQAQAVLEVALAAAARDAVGEGLTGQIGADLQMAVLGTTPRGSLAR